MTIITVGQGAGFQFQSIDTAVAAAHDGDIVQVQAGTYYDVQANVNAKITIEGVGGLVKLDSTHDVTNDKGYILANTDLTIRNFEFADAYGGSQNAAGIRYQGGNLTVENSYFHNNENGILGNPVPDGTVTIRNSEFAFNGAPNGGAGTHQIYIGQIAKLTVEGSFFHDIDNGFNQIKSRAAETYITGNRILAGDHPYSSWEIDLPNGGVGVIKNNVIQQQEGTANANFISFGVEGWKYDLNTLTIEGNTFVNDIQGRGILLTKGYGEDDAPITLTGNTIYRVDYIEMPKGAYVTETGTVYLGPGQRPELDETTHPYLNGGTSPPPPVVSDPPPVQTPDPTPPVVTPPPPAPPPAHGESWSGAARADTHYATELNDTSSGLADDDSLYGLRGADSLDGGAGRDKLYGGEGADTLSGGDDADQLYGDEGNDLIVGGAGDDKLFGYLGDDTLTGGAGKDLFGFGAGEGRDVITDFAHGADKIDLTALRISKSAFASQVKIVDTADGDLVTVGGTKILVSGVHDLSIADFSLSGSRGDFLWH